MYVPIGLPKKSLLTDSDKAFVNSVGWVVQCLGRAVTKKNYSIKKKNLFLSVGLIGTAKDPARPFLRPHAESLLGG